MRYKKILFAGLAAWMSLSSFAFDLKTESPVIIKGDTTQMAPVAKTALKMLQGDIKKVLGSEMKLQMSSLSKTSDKNESSEEVLIRTTSFFLRMLQPSLTRRRRF